VSEPVNWIDLLERDLEIVEGQIALTAVLPQSTTYVHVETERLKRLVKAATVALRKSELNRDEPCLKGGKHSWIGDDAGDSWCEKCSEVLFE